MICWDKRFLRLAQEVSTWSKDPTTKVGCVLVNDKHRVVALGYNGFPRGVRDLTSRYNNREVKHTLIQHAEANAVLNAVGSTEGTTAYVTRGPCTTCAGLLINAGVIRIVAQVTQEELLKHRSRHNLVSLMCKEADVLLETING